MQVSKELNFFTVYLTAQGIEVCPGCKDYPDWYALHTSKSYESAEQFAQPRQSIGACPSKIGLDQKVN